MQKTEQNVLIGVSCFAAILIVSILAIAVPAMAWYLIFLVFAFFSCVAVGLGCLLIASHREEIESYLAERGQKRAEKRRRLLETQAEQRRQKEEEERRFRESLPTRMMAEPWRAYRGVQFEEFVGRVFQINGIQANVTRASSDQGVDVVASNNGCQLAIQVKGYAGSVGNKAVQEVVAGAQHYKCGHKAVVTNSYFTKSAISLAKSNQVWLIPGNEIPALIHGTNQIYNLFAPNDDVVDAEIVE